MMAKVRLEELVGLDIYFLLLPPLQGRVIACELLSPCGRGYEGCELVR